MTFADASRVCAHTAEQYLWQVEDHWQQGRGAFGGLVLGAMTRAMQTSVADSLRRLRSLSGLISAPVIVGPATIIVELLRVGSALSAVAARLEQEGELRAHCTGVFAASRAIVHKGWRPEHSPVVGSPEEMMSVPVAPPLGPVFALNCEFRSNGAYPYSASSQPVTGWVRFKDEHGQLDAPAIVGLIDSYWPCALVRESVPRPMATVSFSLEMATDPAQLSAEQFVFYRATSEFCADGYSIEHRELWSAQGELLAQNQQVFVVIK
jgi:acyl-CoA thioesterase